MAQMLFLGSKKPCVWVSKWIIIAAFYAVRTSVVMQEKSKEDLFNIIEQYWQVVRVREENARKKTRKTRCLFCRQSGVASPHWNPPTDHGDLNQVTTRYVHTLYTYMTYDIVIPVCICIALEINSSLQYSINIINSVLQIGLLLERVG